MLRRIWVCRGCFLRGHSFSPLRSQEHQQPDLIDLIFVLVPIGFGGEFPNWMVRVSHMFNVCDVVRSLYARIMGKKCNYPEKTIFDG